MVDVVVCPFWRPYRAHFGVTLVDGVPVCDNLVNGVPHCIAFDLYPDDPYSYDSIEDYMTAEPSCRHFVRSDLYSYVMPPFPKKPLQCLYGGESCFHPEVAGFGFCSCCRRFGLEEPKR